MLVTATKPKRDKTQKKEVKKANIAKRSNKQYKKQFQYKELPFDLDNKKGSLIISKVKSNLLEQFKLLEGQNIRDQVQQCTCLKITKEKGESFRT